MWFLDMQAENLGYSIGMLEIIGNTHAEKEKPKGGNK
jgi:hypothetical protein